MTDKISLTKRNSYIDGRTFVGQDKGRSRKLKERAHRRKNIAKATSRVRKTQQQKRIHPIRKDDLETSLDLLMEFGVSIVSTETKTVSQMEQQSEDNENNLIPGSSLFDPQHKLIAANRPLVENPANFRNYGISFLQKKDLDAVEFYASEYGYLYNVLEPGIMSLYSVRGTKFTNATHRRGNGAKIQAS